MIVCFLSFLFGTDSFAEPPSRIRRHGSIVGASTQSPFSELLARTISPTGQESGPSDRVVFSSAIPEKTQENGKNFITLPDPLNGKFKDFLMGNPSAAKRCLAAGWYIRRQNEHGALVYSVTADAIADMRKALTVLEEIPHSLNRRALAVMIVSIFTTGCQTGLSLLQPKEEGVRIGVGLGCLVASMICMLRDVFNYETILRLQERQREGLISFFDMCEALFSSTPWIKTLAPFYTLAKARTSLFQPVPPSLLDMVYFGIKPDKEGNTSLGIDSTTLMFGQDPASLNRLYSAYEDRGLVLEKKSDNVRYTALCFGVFTMASIIAWLASADKAANINSTSILASAFLNNTDNNTKYSVSDIIPKTNNSVGSWVFFISTILSPFFSLLTTLTRYFSWNLQHAMTQNENKLSTINAIQQTFNPLSSPEAHSTEPDTDEPSTASAHLDDEAITRSPQVGYVPRAVSTSYLSARAPQLAALTTPRPLTTGRSQHYAGDASAA